jgi:hypothetical protein
VNPARGDIDQASFRDPSGFVFRHEGVIYRQVNQSFAAEWGALTSSGLLRELIGQRLLVSHEHVDPSMALGPHAIAVLRPEPIDFISYPYEWTFSELKDAALLTLRIQDIAVDHGMTMRDATAFNVQFQRGRPIFIDTLSFEPLGADATWKPYRQFCESFLAPLALMAYRDARMGMLLRTFLDGIPLDLANALLPMRTRTNLGLAAHVHLHARSQLHGAERSPDRARRPMSVTALRALVDGLRRTVEKLASPRRRTVWGAYTPTTSYSGDGARSKEATVDQMLNQLDARWVWAVGANDGHYSAIAARNGRRVIALDQDVAAVERHYLTLRNNGADSILPLVMDVTNPSPGLGWTNTERLSLFDRSNADAVMALALVHHLAISHNLPFVRIVDFFRRLGGALIIEFVPKSDPMVKRLLAARNDIFPDYTIDAFRAAFAESYDISDEIRIADSERSLFLMRPRQ